MSAYDLPASSPASAPRSGAPWRGVGWLIVAALALGLLTVVLNTGLLALSAYVIAAAALHPPLIALSVPLALIRICGVARAFSRYAERLVSHNATFRILARLRADFYARLEPLIPARFLDFRSGDLLTRMVDDVEELENLYGRVVTPVAVAALTILAVGLALWSFSGTLALITVGALLLTGVGIPALAALAGGAIGRRQITARAALQTATLDGIAGLGDLLMAGRAADHATRLAALDRELATLNRRAATVRGLQGGLGEALIYGTLALVLALAMPLAAGGQFGAVYLAALALIILGAAEAITPLGRAFAALGRSRAASERLRQIVSAAPPVADPALPRPIPVIADDPALAFEGVSFRYRTDEEPVLRDLSFAIAPGERVAIVGPSGAGKSTLLSLILRFWDPTAGSIRFAGHNLRAYAQEPLRHALSVVPQGAHLFSDTLRNNLTVAEPGATDADLLDALDRAGLRDLLAALPHGLDTWIGDHGLGLSGGERQRVVLARAFLRDAPLLLLDEPTANLDPATESAILDTIHRGAAGRSLVVVTHRLVGMDRFDTILVLDQGRIIERGAHSDLVARDGLYRRLYARQNAILAG